MSALSDLQSDFQSFLLDGNERMLSRVTGTAKVSTEQRLAIYYDAYRLRLLEALTSNYPVLRAWIGDEEFEKGMEFARKGMKIYHNALKQLAK